MNSPVGRSRRDRPASLALLLDGPEPVGFLDVRVWCGWLWYQLRALFTEMIETAPQLFPGECVLIVGPIRYLRREALSIDRSPMAAAK
ncbi:hypothetical protein [Bradyrhizobium sp. URHD0069]|uniref:hypothetical protein n=1 Tax=Bradyrhizobium sp. URHD0069 TaxID=1380355 RepID=UPI0012DFAB21|nr:hypothetical protein [Bradyrhizobium sp. URHD0069]